MTCPSLSPESRSQCVLPDTAEAHAAGHESAVTNGVVRVVWAPTTADAIRWGRLTSVTAVEEDAS